MTLTFTEPITYSGPVVVSDENGVVQFSGINVVGGQNVSGVRYQASNGGGIDTGQGGETCIPGTAQGIKMNDGWYN